MKHNLRKLDIVATLACIGVILCWSASPNFIKFLTGYLDSWTQNLLRYSAACLFWLPFLFFSIKRKKIDKKLWKIAVVPACFNIIMQSAWAGALYYTEPAFLTLLTKCSIIFVTVLSMIVFVEERSLLKSRRFWCGLALSFIGVAGILASKEGFASRNTIIGALLALTTSITWAFYTVSAKVAFRNVDSRLGFAVITIYTVIGLCFFGFIFGQPGQCLTMGVRPWVYVIVSGVVSIAIGHVLFYIAIKRIGATIPALMLLSSPFVVLAISYAAFGETLSIFQWFFGIILLAGSAIAIWTQQHLK